MVIVVGWRLEGVGAQEKVTVSEGGAVEIMIVKYVAMNRGDKQRGIVINDKSNEVNRQIKKDGNLQMKETRENLSHKTYR